MVRTKNDGRRARATACGAMAAIIFAVLMGIGSAARGAVTTIALYELEGVAGSAAPLPVDSSGNANHFTGGIVDAANVNYSSDVPAGIGSTTSVEFGTGPAGYYFTASPLPQDNFGFEVWAKTTQANAVPDAHLLGNSANLSGIEVGTTGGNYYAAISSVTFIAQVPIVDNVWTHLALVRDSGVTSFYINGVFIASSAAAPWPVSDNGGANAHFGVNAFAGAGYIGLADQARFFSFNPGEFEVSDLSYVAIPTPGALPTGLAMLALAASRRRGR